ncbi:MAG: type II toxin-antitoxin system VapC family toxin [Lachnospiraceae bacterium]|nr:type II toxin-antitoxin system VapC family toxin [Lachnospiraceae bacterium]
MRILLDTHIALWAIADTSKLSNEVILLLETANNEVFYSMASVWEIAIKHKIKPENMPMSEEKFVELCEFTGFICLPIKDDHIFCIKTLKQVENAPKHNDPFDRMLLAQAKAEGLKLITHDSLIPYYGENCTIFV